MSNQFFIDNFLFFVFVWEHISKEITKKKTIENTKERMREKKMYQSWIERGLQSVLHTSFASSEIKASISLFLIK